jgi:hypothetical protein
LCRQAVDPAAQPACSFECLEAHVSGYDRRDAGIGVRESLFERDCPGRERPVLRHPLLKLMALVVALAVLSFAAATVSAAVTVLAPAGTKVALKYMEAVDTATIKPGDPVHFHVAADVLVDGKVVIKMSTPVTGTVDKVGHESVLNSGFANISNLAVMAVDHRAVRLKDVRVSAKIFGGNKRILAGALVTTGTTADATIRLPY